MPSSPIFIYISGSEILSNLNNIVLYNSIFVNVTLLKLYVKVSI